MATAPDATGELLSFDWLGACQRAVEGLREVLAENPTSNERVIETGETGGGGDQTLVIDAAAEDAVFAELERLHAARRALHRGLRGARLRRLRLRRTRSSSSTRSTAR